MGKDAETKSQTNSPTTSTTSQTNPLPAAELSRPFYLAHRVAKLNIQPPLPPKNRPWNQGDPVLPPVDADLIPSQVQLPNLNADFEYDRVVKRWLYIFQKREDKWMWFGEYWVDEAGNYHPVDIKQAQGKERDKRPQPSNDSLNLLSLPYKINGKQVISGFLLIGTRLPLQRLQELEKQETWDYFDTYDLDPELYKGAYYIPDQTGLSYIRVKDQLWYTISVNKMMKQLRDMAIGWITPADDMDAQSRKRTEERGRKKLIAQTIKELLENDPDDKLDLRDDFHPNPVQNYATGGEEVMRQWLKDYDETTKWWLLMVEKAGQQLTVELDSKAMKFVTDTYRLLEKVDSKGYEADMPLYQKEYADCLDRITETSIGAAWIDTIIKDKGHWVHEYVLRQGPPEGVRFQVMRKSSAALLSIWAELPARHILVHGDDYLVTLVDFLNWEKDGVILTDRYKITARDLILPGTTRVEVASHWQLNNTEPELMGRRSVTSKMVVKDIDMAVDPKVTKITKEAEKVFLAIEIINLILACKSLYEKAGGQSTSENVWASVGILGSSLDATTAFGALSGMKKGTLVKIGAVSAVLDMILAIRAVGQQKDIGDINAAIASGVVATGSGLIAIGYAMSFFGAGGAWTGVGIAAGIIGAVLVVLGYILSLFTSANHFELFVMHSVWGSRYGDDDGFKLWSEGAFKGWHERNPDGLTRQVAAMTNLLAGFTISGMRWKVRIHFGLQNEKMKLLVKFATDFMDEHQEVTVSVDPANHRTRVVDPNDPGRKDAGGVITHYGSTYLEMQMNFRDRSDSLPADQRQLFENDHEMDCWVRLDYNGDESRWMPEYPKWAYYRTKALSTSKATSSVDY